MIPKCPRSLTLLPNSTHHSRSIASRHGYQVRPSPASTANTTTNTTLLCAPSSILSPRYHTQRHAPGPTARSLPNVRASRRSIPPIWFTSTPPVGDVSGGREDGDHKPPDERTLKLGKTIRILHSSLPTLLASPLPQEILSPHISLHLFPSTHPHLPTVSGRVAYTAALWTAPVAWGRVPIVGNVRLVILSERMFKSTDSSPSTIAGAPPDAGSWSEDTTTAATGTEKLLVRWKTCGRSSSPSSPLTDFLHSTTTTSTSSSSPPSSSSEKDKDNEFTGLFIFTFDHEGRIATHTIEHAERRDGSDRDRMGAVVSVTDWLLGRARWRRAREGDEVGWAFGCCQGGGGGKK